MATHTPTPWQADQQDSYSLAIMGWDHPNESSVLVAEIGRDDGDPPTETQRANADFIVLAANCHDELLTMLMTAVMHIERIQLAGLDTSTPVSEVAAMNAAIAKAIGETR